MTYLSDFRDYMKTRTDAPEAFHMHAGLCTLAVAMGVRCWVDGPSREIFPNLNCVVLAPSGMGKSVPLDMSASILRKAGMGDCILPASFSQEAILQRLSQRPIGFWVIQEFAAFQALLGRDYNSGAEQTLTELYDVPEEFTRSLKSETYRLQYPCVTILGASSPDWFAQAFKGSALRGGWLARFLFCPSRDAGKPIGDPGPRDQNVEGRLAGHLNKLRNLSGRFDISEARAIYNDFSARCRLAARESADFGGMRSRGPTMALKIAMLFHVSREPTSNKLSSEDMSNAIKFVERTHVMAEKYLTDEVAHDRKDADRMRILEIVRGAGGRVSWSAALKGSHQDARDFETAVRTLVDSDRLSIERDGRAKVLALPEFPNSHGNFRESGNFRNGAVSPVGAGAV